MKHPKVDEVIKFRFAGIIRIGVVIEVRGSGLDKQWCALSEGIYYPCLVLDRKKMHHILQIIETHE
jgi:hypothetical protein